MATGAMGKRGHRSPLPSLGMPVDYPVRSLHPATYGSSVHEAAAAGVRFRKTDSPMAPTTSQSLQAPYLQSGLESAGIPKESVSGRNVGVFVGGNFSDYELNNLRDLETCPPFQATGNAPALQSNRISCFFNLQGPSFTVDTACSSSLVALHYAVQSLRSGESREALVGGCRLNVLPDYFVSMSMSQ